MSKKNDKPSRPDLRLFGPPPMDLPSLSESDVSEFSNDDLLAIIDLCQAELLARTKVTRNQPNRRRGQ